MSRFTIDLTDISTERKVMKAGAYEAAILKSEVKTGDNKEDDGKWMRIETVYVVKDEEVIKDLGTDEPKVYGSFFVSFDKETGAFRQDNNIGIGQLLKATGLDNGSVDFEDGITDDMSDWEAKVKYFSNLTEAVADYPVLITVGRRAVGDNMRAEVTKIAKFG